MAPPPRVSGLSRESVPGAPAWMDPVFMLLGEALGQTSFALGKRLTFSENFAAQLKDITFRQPAHVWRTPELQNNWVNFGGTANPAGYRISPYGRVYTRGSVKNGSGLGTKVFDLDAGYRPAYDETLVTVGSGPTLGRIDVLATGEVIISNGSTTWTQLDGLSFDAATPAALPDIPEEPLAFVRHSLDQVSGVLPIYWRVDSVSPNRSSGAPVVDWDLAQDGKVRIRAVHGLAPGVKHTVRLLIFSR